MSRRSRHRALAQEPRRGNLPSGVAVLLVLVHLALAQLTLMLFVCLTVTSRISRWQPLWLAAPAAAGLILVLSAGDWRAAAGYAAVGGDLVRQLTGTGPVMLRIARLPALLGDWQRWLPAQLPLALIVASAQAAVWHLLGRRLAGGGTWYRPGAVVAVRRAYLTATLRRGEVATLDGGCVGVDPRTGRRAAISWTEAQRGVLCTGQTSQAVTATGLEIVLAAIRHRKAVIVVDLSGGAGEQSIEDACTDVGAPLRWFDAARGGYQPFAGVSPDRGAELVSELIDWSGLEHARQSFSTSYLNAALGIAATTTAGQGRSPAPVLDELVRLLQPGDPRARPRRLPPTAELEADPAALAAVAAQLRRLRSSALGCRLRPAGITAGAEAELSLATALVTREVVVFSLGRPSNGRSAVQIARLVVTDLTGVLAQRRELGVRDDCLVWINGCEAVGQRQLATLVALGSATGTCVVLASTAGAVAASLADTVNVVLLRGGAPADLPTAVDPAGDDSGGPADRAPATMPGLPERLSLRNEGTSGLGALLSVAQRADEVSLRVRGPRPRVVTRCRVVR